MGCELECLRRQAVDRKLQAAPELTEPAYEE